MTGTPSPFLGRILSRLDRGGSPDARWPDPRGEYWGLCPFHADRHVGSFSVSDRGFSCFSCGAQGDLATLAAHLGSGGDASMHAFREGTSPPSPPPSPPLTLERYAEAKRLPVDWLYGQGLETAHRGRRTVLRIPYFDAQGKKVAIRFRHSLDGSGPNRFSWRTGDKSLPYGLWRLAEARAAGYLLLVEGESDAQTLWHYGLPALGIPGATTWSPEWAPALEGLTLYAWQEPDAGGAGFVKSLGASLPGLLLLSPPAGRKDISECHLLGDDVPALVARLIASAIPYEQILAAEASAEVARLEALSAPLLDCPSLLDEFTALCTDLSLVGEGKNAQILYLALTSRLLKKPVSVAVKGPSGGGKSFLVETVLKAFPAEAFYALSGMSEHALAYSQEPLAHRTLVLFEAGGLSGPFAAYIMRSLVSEGHLKYETVEKTAKGLVPRVIERAGPTGLVTTTTQVSLDAELETRMLSLTVRDDREQTRAVFRATIRRANGFRPDPARLEPWIALQLWLGRSGPWEVVLPFGDSLCEMCEPSAVRLRRDFTALVQLIKAHALLHCRQRRVVDGRLVAEIADYRAVHELVAGLMSEGVEAVIKRETRDTVEALTALYLGTPVTMRALAARLGIDPSSLSRRVRVSTRAGWIVNQETRRGMPAQLVPGDPLPPGHLVLPEPADLAAIRPPEGSRGGEGPYPPEMHASLHHLPEGRPPKEDATGTAAPAGEPTVEPGEPGMEVFDL